MKDFIVDSSYILVGKVILALSLKSSSLDLVAVTIASSNFYDFIFLLGFTCSPEIATEKN